MEEEATSWIRRTKFSHTICHRFDSARLASIPFTIQPERNSGLKSRPGTASVNQTAGTSVAEGQRKPVTNKQRSPIMNKQRSLSPLPKLTLSDAFKEARHDRKRFSTPHPRRTESEKGLMGKLFHKDSHETRARGSRFSSNTSPLQSFSFTKFYDKTKTTKELSWAKYFDHGGGRVTSVETADEWMVDLSKLFLGLKFAHGAHSQLYHGIYKDEPVAVKIIRVPEDYENEDLAARLERQFNREVTLLSRLYHQNVIKKLITTALEIARGMEYIHSQGVIHRDLKPENILVNQDFHLKIADFGIACEEAYCDLLAEDPGTYRWMAPEMIKRKSYGRKVDVYSFGLILWEMVAGAIPYEDMTPIQAAFAVVNKNLRPAIPGDCSPAMKTLIEQCWCLHPEKRPEFWQVVKVLEEFESSLARDGTLNLIQHPTGQDHKKGPLQWIQKLGPVHPNSSSMSSMPKPKFS
ncbi:serine/threonine/tyrosine-protein kinase HT1-like isoform X2 [Cornus florida]|uniref:serine/threonine/tyrosine-protein kinase HT1-like isoform X2 n=1 Tax=Cornus florida TaxID=4283 RepID=UPI00289BB1E9|nr:serine/threonine/tyrosine-protein kinase HT1-like isoform X2 [Cornus florida]